MNRKQAEQKMAAMWDEAVSEVKAGKGMFSSPACREEIKRIVAVLSFDPYSKRTKRK
jgi:hypothetical protein